MKLIAVFSLFTITFTVINFSAQTNLLEHIPTNEFAVVKFDGASLNSKSSTLNQLAISDSISDQFNRLLKEYRQFLIDDNTSVSDAGVEQIKMEIDQAMDAVEDAVDAAEDTANEAEEAYDTAEEAYEVETVDDYNYNNDSYNNYYKVTPKLKLENIFVALMTKGTEYGINNNSNYYFIVGMNDSINHNALLFNKSNGQKFDEFIDNLIPKDQRSELVLLKNGYEYFADDDLMIAWNKDIVAFVDYSIPYRYDYYNYEEKVESNEEEYYETYEERLAAEAKKKAEEKKLKLESVLNDLFNGKPEHSLKFNANYTKSLTEKGDVSYFMDALGSNANLYFKALGGSSSKRNNEFLSLFKDNFGYGSLTFNNNDITVNTLQHMGGKYVNQVRAMNKKKFNKSMYKYIDGENLLGIAGFAMKPEPAYEMYKDMYINILGSIREEEEWLGTLADIGFTFFDEAELFDLIQGDFVFAVTDIKEFDMEYTSYDYDEDYNRIEKIETKKETLPEFVSIATVGNKELRDKVIKIMKQTDVIIEKGHYYELQEPKSRYSDRAAKPLNVFYMLKDDLLIVTNDEKLLKSNNGNGLAKSKQVTGEAYKLMKTNNMFAYWTPNTTYEKMPREFTDELKPLKSIAETYKSFEFSGIKNSGNVFTSTAKVSLIDKSKGSLMLSLDLINDVMRTAVGNY